jgi:glycine cleavage system H protein
VYPKDLRYTQHHQWLRVKDGIGVVGITHYAQEQLGDLVYVDLPSEGDEVTVGEPFGTVESVKAVEDVYAPVGGKVQAVNSDLEDAPERINQDCYGEGWLIRIDMSNESEVNSLMRVDEYEQFVQEQKAKGES